MDALSHEFSSGSGKLPLQIGTASRIPGRSGDLRSLPDGKDFNNPSKGLTVQPGERR
jgi:hypothetical protein